MNKLPTEPGRYWWTAWGRHVEVYKKKGGKHLYVTPPCPGSPEVRITPRIAGTFRPVQP